MWELSNSKKVLGPEDFTNWQRRIILKSNVRNCAYINELGIWSLDSC
jgi:hypothetical protein